MIVYTFQHQFVADKIEKEGVYYLTWEDCDKFSPFQMAKKCYRKLAEHLHYHHAPIWGFVTYDGKEINDSWIEDFIERCYHGSNENHILMKLDIPDKYVTLTSYFDWSDFIFFMEEENEKMSELSWKNTFNYQDVDRIQALTELIKKEWLLATYKPKIKQR